MPTIMERNNITSIGRGEKTILFAHGFGCEQGMWQYITPAFEAEYRLILFDYVGSGNSDHAAYNPNKYSCLEGYAQDVLDVIEELELQDIIFVGHSVSSMIGLLAANQRPEAFAKLIMIGASPCYLNMEDGYQGGFDESDIRDLLDMMEMNFGGWASYMAPMALEQPEESPQSRQLERQFVSNNPQVARQFAEVTFFSDCRERLGFAQIPTLLMQCSHDSIVPLGVAEYLHEKLPNSVLQIMDAKGHYPHISHPEETVAIIKQYLEV